MKTLNSKLELKCVMFFLVLSVLFTSCNKDEIDTNQIEDQTTQETLTVTPEQGAKTIYFKPPKGFEKKTSKEQQDFFDQLSSKDGELLIENYRIADYLNSKGLLIKSESLINDGELLTDLNLGEILSPDQLQELVKHKTITNKFNPLCNYIRTIYCYPPQPQACGNFDLTNKRAFIEECPVFGGGFSYRWGFFCDRIC